MFTISCFSVCLDHNILDFTATSTTDNSLTISWKYPSYDRIFFLSNSELHVVGFQNFTLVVINFNMILYKFLTYILKRLIKWSCYVYFASTLFFFYKNAQISASLKILIKSGVLSLK